MIRGSPALVIVPKVALLSDVDGPSRFTWLITLKISHRTWSVRAPPTPNVREMATLFCTLPGLTIVNGLSVL